MCQKVYTKSPPLSGKDPFNEIMPIQQYVSHGGLDFSKAGDMARPLLRQT